MEEGNLTPMYFRLIFTQLSQMEGDRWVDKGRIDLLKMDAKMLETFCYCHRTWNYTTDEDEESMERLRSTIAALKLIWPKDFTLFGLLVERMGGSETETRPMYMCIQDIDSIMFELEVKIQQSKQQVEGWYKYSTRYSLKRQYITFLQVFLLIRGIQENLKLFSSHRAGEIVSLKKQIDILIAKVVFLQGKLGIGFDKLKDERELLPFLNFVGDFANSVACLTFLYWAIEDGDETASEMNILLFDMLQKFIPYAYDITPLYVGILKSNNLRLGPDSFPPGKDAESFVNFFFEHLAIVLKDDYLILQDSLMFLFTFLTNPPCEHAEGGDSIRSQIYAILHEDVYLGLSFDEMKEAFSDKKALFVTIDIANAKIRAIRQPSSDSWITLEVEKLEYDYFVSVHSELCLIEKQARRVDMKQLQLYKRELRFLRVFLLWLATWDDTDEEIKLKLSSIITSFRGIWGVKEGERLLAHRLRAIRTGSSTDWHPLAFELQEKFQQSKLETGAWCVDMFHSSFRFKTSTSDQILEFLGSIVTNLRNLVDNKASEIVPFKKQIETLEEKIIFLRNFLSAVSYVYYEESGEFKMFVQAFANDAACLTFLYWAKDANVVSASETNSMLSHMLQKIKPATPDVARMYFGTLMAIDEQRYGYQYFGRTAFSFVELFLEDLVTHLKDDDFQILQNNILFLLTFLSDHPNKNAEELICTKIDVVFWEGLYNLVPFDDTEGCLSKKKVLLSVFMLKIEAINANIRHIYGKFPGLSLCNFPKVISPQFLDFLIQNLRNLKDRMISDRKYVPFARYKIIKIEEELVSLSPFFVHIFNMKSELNETWLEVVSVIHLTEHVIMSCISSWFVFDHPFWYHMAYLSYVYDEIKVVKAKLKKIKENIIYNARCLPNSSSITSELAVQARPSEINEIIVGFEDEAEKIISMLTMGPKSLDIVSIVGMGGLGKTTLAKKVFDSSLVKCHFDVFSFCSVSQEHNTTRLLLDILRDINGVDDIISDMTNDDLAHKLRKRLSRQKYLIVLDDIWVVSAWNEVKSSFPDHENGSRVMFTTRSREVANKCRINCSPHQLRFLYEIESWELLQNKVFHNGVSPPYLCEIGKLIAKNCNGLALAVVVIAGLLARTEKNLSWWSEVAQRLAYYLSKEGCMDILELSYKHLPENLKPCLLYLGTFPKDRHIEVKRVILLWIAEGFVQDSKTKDIEDVAKEYFHDLVDRSFIIVGARSSSGGIKTCHVHDLIHDLCQTKCRDENFFHLNHENGSPSSSNPSINHHYRVSTRKESDLTIAAGSSLSNARTIHFFREIDYGRYKKSPLRELGLVQVLDLDFILEYGDVHELVSLIHLRYINALLGSSSFIPSSISDLWNIGSLMLEGYNNGTILLPKTFWGMKSLRHVKVVNCILVFSDGAEHEAYLPSDEIMDKVVSFSKPFLSTGKDVKRLLQRLPIVQKLSCFLRGSRVYDEESIETLDFHRELESLKLIQWQDSERSIKLRRYMVNFPSSTLKKLTLERFVLHRTDLSAIAELHCLQVLKLRDGSFVEPTLETEDLAFRNLIFFQLFDEFLVEWKASTQSFPCLEQLDIQCRKLKGLPPCFGEMSTLKRIVCLLSPEAESSALGIQEELMELGIQLEVSIPKHSRFVSTVFK